MTLFAFLSAAVVLSAAQVNVGGDPKTDFVVAGDKAYGLILPVQVVAEADVRQALWSPDGNYVLAIRHDPRITPEMFARVAAGDRSFTPPESTSTLLLWNKRSRKTVDLWKASGNDAIQRFDWLGESSVAIATVVHVATDDQGKPLGSQQIYLEVSTAAGSARVIRTEPPGGSLPMVVHPSEPVAAFISTQILPKGDPGRFRQTAEIYRAGKGFEIRRELPPAVQVQFWSGPGLSMYASRTTKTDDLSEPWKLERWIIDMQTGAQRLLADTAPFYDRPFRRWGDVPIELMPNQTLAPRFGLQPLWLVSRNEAEKVRALVTQESSYSELSPKLDGVLYITRGVAMVRPVVVLPKSAYDAAVLAAQKLEVLNRAKQLGTGMMIYATDNNDTLPGSEMDMNSLLEPYMKNRSMFEGFVYTFKGGSLRDIQQPSRTEIGYVTGPGGRAVIYSDSHVKWIPD